MISNSEDKSIRIWDMNNRVLVDTYKKDLDRFWIIAVHPENNFIATGSDSGFIVFNLNRERIPYQLIGNNVIYAFKK